MAKGCNRIHASFVRAHGDRFNLARECTKICWEGSNNSKFPAVRMFLPFLFVLLCNDVVGPDKGRGRIPTEMVCGLVGIDSATFHGILVLVWDWNGQNDVMSYEEGQRKDRPNEN